MSTLWLVCGSRLLEHQDDADIDEPITIDESQMAEFGLGGGGAPRQPLTDEERKAAVEALKAKIAAKRAEKAKVAELDEVDKEKQRREIGQKSAVNAQERKEAQEKLAIAQAKREKAAEQAYLESLKEKVRLEREERLAKRSGVATEPAPVATSSAQPASEPIQAAPKAASDYSECQLQIRLTNGQNLKASFAPTQTIKDVVAYVQTHRTDGKLPFVLMTNFPKTVFDTPDKQNTTLFDASTSYLLSISFYSLKLP